MTSRLLDEAAAVERFERAHDFPLGLPLDRDLDAPRRAECRRCGLIAARVILNGDVAMDLGRRRGDGWYTVALVDLDATWRHQSCR